MFAESVIAPGSVAYLNCPAVHPAMLRESNPPATSAPLAFTNLIVCVPAFPAMQMRPSELTVIALEPTVNFIPTKLP